MAFALLCCIASAVQAETFTARVIAVLDGDTVLILREGGGEAAGHPPASPSRGLRKGKPKKLRMANIDAPESGQDFGRESRDSLLGMVGEKQAQIETLTVDRYERIVGLVRVDGLNANEEQVRRGMAWEYSHHHSNRTYLDLQNEARQAKRGLWAQPDPQPPWQWRKSHPAEPSIQNQECGKKRLCSQMTSCDEAHFYLTRCGVTTLDRNGDGKPCEDLCRSRN